MACGSSGSATRKALTKNLLHRRKHLRRDDPHEPRACVFCDGRFVLTGPSAGRPDVVMETFNYFNYYTEIEEYFWQKRGAHLLVSPLDWAIVETWQKAGIP